MTASQHNTAPLPRNRFAVSLEVAPSRTLPRRSTPSLIRQLVELAALMKASSRDVAEKWQARIFDTHYASVWAFLRAIEDENRPTPHLIEYSATKDLADSLSPQRRLAALRAALTANIDGDELASIDPVIMTSYERMRIHVLTYVDVLQNQSRTDQPQAEVTKTSLYTMLENHCDELSREPLTHDVTSSYEDYSWRYPTVNSGKYYDNIVITVIPDTFPARRNDVDSNSDEKLLIKLAQPLHDRDSGIDDVLPISQSYVDEGFTFCGLVQRFPNPLRKKILRRMLEKPSVH